MNTCVEISVIVPIYNSEKYLQRCIDSILSQTFKDYELLLIDDGSTDCSGDICNEYARKDNRIKVFHQQNKGVSAVRQFGIENACGVYSIHVDSDDWVEPNMLWEMYQTALNENSDLVIADFFVNTTEKQIYRFQKPTALNSEQVLYDILSGSLHGSTGNKLLKQALYKQYAVSFPENLNYCEDVLIWVQILQHNIKISYLPEAFYHYDYQINQNSITRNYTHDTYQQRCIYLQQLQTYLHTTTQYGDLFDKIKLDIKFEAFISNIFDSKELYNMFKESADYISQSAYTRINKALMKLILLRCGFLAYCLYIIKLKIPKK